MWHVGGHKLMLRSVIASGLLVITGAYAEEPRMLPATGLPTETAKTNVTEITTDPRISPGITDGLPKCSEEQQLMMFTGNKLIGLFEGLQGKRVTLKASMESTPGCPVLVSPSEEGGWIVEDYGVDFVKLGKADESGSITYPIGRLCLWSSTGE